MSETEARRQFGRSLVAFREARGLYQKELAAKAGLHVTTISKYERGTCTPRLEALWRLSQALGVSIDALVGRASPRRSPEVEARLQRWAELIEEIPDSRRAFILRAFDEVEAEVRRALQAPERGATAAGVRQPGRPGKG